MLRGEDAFTGKPLDVSDPGWQLNHLYHGKLDWKQGPFKFSRQFRQGFRDCVRYLEWRARFGGCTRASSSHPKAARPFLAVI